MYMKCGEVAEAVRVFQGMKFKNIFSCNVLISGFVMNSSSGMAMEAFDMMFSERVKSDGVTFLAFLCACCHHGFIDKGRRIFNEMKTVLWPQD
nr:pentatricopeptide repeat protein AaPPR758 [Agave angustifolia]